MAVRSIVNEPTEVGLNNWYVNWITLYRRRFALITNSKTLFSVLMYCGTKKDIENFEVLFIDKLTEQIERLNRVNSNWKEKIDLRLDNTKFTKTNSLKILAHMRDFKIRTEYYILDKSNMENELQILTDKINELPIGTINYKSPTKILIETLNAA